MAATIDHSRVLFLHVGWAREYKGAKNDPPQGSFGFIAAGTGTAGETVNFKSFRGTCFGYAPQSSINLSKLGLKQDADYLDGVLVVFTATAPDGSGRFIVGWYRSARVYAERQDTRPDRDRPDFFARADAANCILVAADERVFFVPSMRKGWPGVSSAYYASENLSRKDMAVLLAYIDGAQSSGFATPKIVAGPKSGGSRNQDAESRNRIEVAAVDTVRAHYEARGFEVESVESENLGYDLHVDRGARRFLVEVKGRGTEGDVELTPREYSAMTNRRTRISYRLAIVEMRSPLQS